MRDWTKRVDGQATGFVSRAEEDLALLDKILEFALPEDQREAFTEMRREVKAGRRERLSGKQRQWARDVLDEHIPQYENLVSTGKVPRGREVETPEVLRNLPKRPPPRPKTDD